LNDVAWSVVNSQRSKHDEYVFVYRQERRVNHHLVPIMKYHRIGTINNNAWQAARARVGISNLRVHDLRHTCATRLRAVGVGKRIEPHFLDMQLTLCLNCMVFQILFVC
jgi:integrase